MQEIKLTKKDCYCDLLIFYGNVAVKMGYGPFERLSFNCTKICVTKPVQDLIWSHYVEEEHASDEQISMLLVLSGPKANLKVVDSELMAIVEDGFVTRIE